MSATARETLREMVEREMRAKGYAYGPYMHRDDAVDVALRLLSKEQRIRLETQASMWREAAGVANRVSGAGYVVSYCVDRAITFEKLLAACAQPGGEEGNR